MENFFLWLGGGVGIIGLLFRIIHGSPSFKNERYRLSVIKFISTVKYLKENRTKLVAEAFDRMCIGKKSNKVSNVTCLINDNWIVDKPIILDNVILRYRPKANDNFDEIKEKISKLMPYNKEYKRYNNYSEAYKEEFISDKNKKMKEIDPSFKGIMFENRASYRLMSYENENNKVNLTFGISKYFDYFDLGESFAFELAKYKREKSDSNHLKGLIRDNIDPFDLTNRIANPGIITLTIKKTQNGSKFYLFKRSNLVATWPNYSQVVPCGEFQPASYFSEEKDLNIWKNIMREYSEEFQGVPEASYLATEHINYQTDKRYKEFSKAKTNGKVNAYYLGTVICPLSFKPNILTVCIWEEDVFNKLFRNRKDGDEGEVIRRFDGFDFNEEEINKLKEKKIIPESLACLILSWKFRKELGL